MVYKKLQYILLFSLVVSFSAPVHAFWGQETLSSWAHSVTSYIADVKEHPADHKVAVAIGTVCTLGLAAAVWGVWSWWKTPAQPEEPQTDPANSDSSGSGSESDKTSDVSSSESEGDELSQDDQQTISADPVTSSHINSSSYASASDTAISTVPTNSIGLLGGLLTGIAGAAAASQSSAPSSAQSTGQSYSSDQAEQQRIAQEQAAAQAEQLRLQQEKAAREHIDAGMQRQAIQDNPNAESPAACALRIKQEQTAQAEQQRIAQERAAAQAAQLRLQQEIAQAEAQAEQLKLQHSTPNVVQPIVQSGPSSSSDPVVSQPTISIDHNPSAPTTSANVQNQRQVQTHPGKRRMTDETRALLKAKKQSEKEEGARRLALDLQAEEDREKIHKVLAAEKEATYKADYDAALLKHQIAQKRIEQEQAIQEAQLKQQQEQECDRVIEYYQAIYGCEPTAEILVGLQQDNWRHILDVECRRVTKQAYEDLNGIACTDFQLNEIFATPGEWMDWVKRARNRSPLRVTSPYRSLSTSPEAQAQSLSSSGSPELSMNSSGGSPQKFSTDTLVKNYIDHQALDRLIPAEWPEWSVVEQQLNERPEEFKQYFLSNVIKLGCRTLGSLPKESHEVCQKWYENDPSQNIMDVIRVTYESIQNTTQQKIASKSSSVRSPIRTVDRNSGLEWFADQIMKKNDVIPLDQSGLLREAEEMQIADGERALNLIYRRFIPKTGDPVGRILQVCNHGTFSNADSFGKNVDDPVTNAYYAALQVIADKERVVVDLCVPQWSGRFSESDRVWTGAELAHFIECWRETCAARSDLKPLAIDIEAHSEGNTVIGKALSSAAVSAATKSLITWYCISPTVGAKNTPHGIKARYTIWSPSDVTAVGGTGARIIEAIQSADLWRKPKDALFRSEPIINIALRINGKYANHVDAPFYVLQVFHELREHLKKTETHCEWVMDINTLTKNVSFGIRKESRRPVRFVTDQTNEELSQALGLDAAGKQQFSRLYGSGDMHEMPHTKSNYALKLLTEYIPQEGRTVLALGSQKKSFEGCHSRYNQRGYSQSISECRLWQVAFDKNVRAAIEPAPVVQSLMSNEANLPICSSSQMR